MSCYDLSEKDSYLLMSLLVSTLIIEYNLLNSLYYTPYGILYTFEKKTSNYDQEIQSHTVNQPTAL